MRPQLFEVGSPSPKKDNPASAIMARPVKRIMLTATRGNTSGKKCLRIRYHAPAPYVSADLIYWRSFNVNTCERTILAGNTQEKLSGMTIVKAFTSEPEEIKRFRKAVKDSRKYLTKIHRETGKKYGKSIQPGGCGDISIKIQSIPEGPGLPGIYIPSAGKR